MKRIFALIFCMFLSVSAFSAKLSPQRQNFITFVLKLIGTPYVWGGEDPRGFDCSGIIMYAAKNGIEGLKIILPRDANSMYERTIPIKPEEREPGDLVFFKDNLFSSKITHVGIYCGTYHGKLKEFEGEKVFLSALSAGNRKGIQISKIDGSYWKNKVYSYGRIMVTSAQYAQGQRVIKKGK